MKVLFDHGIPAPLRNHLSQFEIDRSAEKGWETYENGELIRNAEAEGYDVILTTDQGMQYQQNLKNRNLAIVILQSTAWPKIRDRIGEISQAIMEVERGEFRIVPI